MNASSYLKTLCKIKYSTKGFIFLLLLLSYDACFSQKTQVNGFNFNYLQNRVQSWIDSGYYNGASIVVVKDNKTIYEHQFGTYTPTSVAYIASAGKWLAAATIAAVVDDGKLTWDDKVNKWLPEFNDEKGKATLAQLLSHTSGFPDYQPKGEQTDNYQTLKESVAHIVHLPADTLAGTKFKYGGLAMQVAGRMAELATGKDWETLFQEKIAKPLGMSNTHFTPVDATPGHSPMLGGGARTTLEDYAHFLNMVSNEGGYAGKRILSKKVIVAMQADHVGNAIVKKGEFVENVRQDFRKDVYGLGEWREEVDANGKPTLISSPSWAGAYPWIDKVNHIYGFFLARVNVEKAIKHGFNAFYTSPILPLLVREVLKDAAHPEVKQGFVPIENGKLFYEEAGKGQPIIFIHGHSFDHYEWDPQFFALAKKYHVIRYDVRGYGRSSMPTEFSNQLHAKDLLQLMDFLHIQKANLVGLSMGGFIVSDFLALNPNRLFSATAASGDVFHVQGPSEPWKVEDIEKRRNEIETYKNFGILKNKMVWYDALTIRDGKPIESLRKPLWDMIYKWTAWQPLHIEPRFLLGNDLAAKLKSQKIKVPVMVLTGDVDAQQKNQLLPLIPSAMQVFIPRAGHVSNLENAEGFTAAIERFISSINRK